MRRRSPRRKWLGILVLLSLLALAAPARSLPAQTRAGEGESAKEQDWRVRRAISRGLEYLKRQQNEDGSWTDKIGRKVHYKYEGSRGKHIGVTALACLAFLSNGNLPGRGKYGEQVERGLDFIIKNTQTNGFVSVNNSRMYSHAFCTLFLAEIYGMTGMDRVRDCLKRSVALIVRAQNGQGGWRYQPGADDADMSITVCQVMALRAAHNAGVHVPKTTVDQAIRYVRSSFHAQSGAFMYQHEPGPHGRPQPSRTSFALTAAGVTALYGAGVYDDEYILRGLKFMKRNLPPRRVAKRRFDYYYGLYYATQAAFQRGGDYWDDWQQRVWRDLLLLQEPNGSWKDLVGSSYATAMACVILEIPNQYLPIFER
ncbi:MAG: prenyltransferase/squalene oxidase repeat-containing protein [Planctomycetota bacterium]